MHMAGRLGDVTGWKEACRAVIEVFPDDDKAPNRMGWVLSFVRPAPDRLHLYIPLAFAQGAPSLPRLRRVAPSGSPVFVSQNPSASRHGRRRLRKKKKNILRSHLPHLPGFSPTAADVFCQSREKKETGARNILEGSCMKLLFTGSFCSGT